MRTVKVYSNIFDTREIRTKADMEAVLKSIWNLMFALLKDAERDARNDQEFLSNLDSAHGIWRSICAKHPKVLSPDDFKNFVKEVAPNIYKIWQSRKKKDLLHLKMHGR